jgi:hypothetical protein
LSLEYGQNTLIGLQLSGTDRPYTIPSLFEPWWARPTIEPQPYDTLRNSSFKFLV